MTMNTGHGNGLEDRVGETKVEGETAEKPTYDKEWKITLTVMFTAQFLVEFNAKMMPEVPVQLRFI